MTGEHPALESAFSQSAASPDHHASTQKFFLFIHSHVEIQRAGSRIARTSSSSQYRRLRHMFLYHFVEAENEPCLSDPKRASNEHDASALRDPAKRARILHDTDSNTPRGSVRLRNGNYAVAWVCALSIEMAAARATLDEIHESLPTQANDTNMQQLRQRHTQESYC